MGGSARVISEDDDMPIQGTSLRALVDRYGTFHVTGPCGARHSMPETEAIALWKWLGWRLSGKPKHPVRDALEKRDAILAARYSDRPTLADRMAADPTQDWT